MRCGHDCDGVDTALRWFVYAVVILFVVCAALWMLLFSAQQADAGEAIGKALACEADARFAEALQRDVDELQFPVINLLTEHDQDVLDWLKACLDELTCKPTDDLRRKDRRGAYLGEECVHDGGLSTCKLICVRPRTIRQCVIAKCAGTET